MATNTLEFVSQIDKWVKASNERMLAVFHGSTQELVSRAQSRIPVDTGFARASIRASTAAMPVIDPLSRGEKGAVVNYDYGEVVLVINSAQLGQDIYIGWTANYVQHLEYGHSKQAPSGFVGITTLEWPNIVAGEIEKAKASVASRS